MLVKWESLSTRYLDLGNLQFMLNDEDPRPAREQLDSAYQHFGGWKPFPGFTLTQSYGLLYPGDPPIYPLAFTNLRNEKIVLYPSDWVAIIQPDRSFEVCRMD